MTIIYIIVAIILLPIILHLLRTLKAPNLNNYFQPGQTYHSEGEGITR